MIRRLILWRHGRTEWNAEARFQGQADPPLDQLGAEQARVAAVILAMEKPDAIFTSDLVRAASTAAELARLTGLAVISEVRLRETSLGRWEGLTRAEVELAYPAELADWQAGKPVRRGNGETAEEVAERAVRFIDTIDATAGQTVVIVAHGGTNKAVAGRLLGLDPTDWFKIAPLANCHWTELRRDSAGSWRLYQHNVGPLAAVHTPTEDAAESTPNVDSDEKAVGRISPTDPQPTSIEAPGSVPESAVTPPPGAPANAAAAPAPPPATYTREEVAGEYRYEQLLGRVPGPDPSPSG